MSRLDTFLRLAADQKASDLHFHAGKVPMVRHDGELVDLPFRALSEPQVRAFLDELFTPAQSATLDSAQQVDFAYELPWWAGSAAACAGRRVGSAPSSG